MNLVSSERRPAGHKTKMKNAGNTTFWDGQNGGKPSILERRKCINR
jgi:hypothetical protein